MCFILTFDTDDQTPWVESWKTVIFFSPYDLVTLTKRFLSRVTIWSVCDANEIERRKCPFRSLKFHYQRNPFLANGCLPWWRNIECNIKALIRLIYVQYIVWGFRFCIIFLLIWLLSVYSITFGIMRESGYCKVHRSVEFWNWNIWFLFKAFKLSWLEVTLTLPLFVIKS